MHIFDSADMDSTGAVFSGKNKKRGNRY